jgi:hypothetical protein
MLIQYTTLYAQRRETLFAQIVNLRTYLTQSIHQLTNRAVMHAFYAIQNGRLTL